MITTTSPINVGPAVREPGTPGAPPARKAQGALGKDDFLKLLVAQLRNQDPQSPASPDQMAAQLAQFSSVEQLQNISETLEAQKLSQNSLLNEVASSAATGNIGRTITATSDLIELNGSGSETMLVTGNGGLAQLTVFDARTGREIETRQMGVLGSGTNEINIGRSLSNLPPGVYRVAVTTPENAGRPVDWSTAIKGVVSGVVNTSEGMQYAVGNLRVPLSAVTEVSSR
jgi:flagellar basal-body rod modification protein FlgD